MLVLHMNVLQQSLSLASPGLPPWEAPVMIAEKHKLFFSYLMHETFFQRNSQDLATMYESETLTSKYGIYESCKELHAVPFKHHTYTQQTVNSMYHCI